MADKIVPQFPLDSQGKPVSGGVSKDDASKVVPDQHDPTTGAKIVLTDYIPPASVEIVVANGTASKKSAALDLVGNISLISVDAPEIGAFTWGLNLLDVSDKAFYAVAGQADNQTALLVVSRRLVATDKIEITTSGNVTENETFTVRIR